MFEETRDSRSATRSRALGLHIVASLIAGTSLSCMALDMDEGGPALDEARATATAPLLSPADDAPIGITAINGTHPGYVTYSASHDQANRCAVDPVSDIDDDIATNPTYILAYRSGMSGCGVWAPTNQLGELIHRQGIQRLDRGGANYLLVSGSVETGYEPGVEIIAMGSRSFTNYRLGSGGVTPTTWPNCADHIVGYLGYPYPQYRDHAGGIQVMGRYLAVPLEHTDDAFTAGFRIVDLNDPALPIWSTTILRSRGPTTNAGAAALTRLNDSTFMVMIFGNDADEVEVFVSNGTTMSLASSFWQSKWQESTPSGFEAYQNLQFITKCDGSLYLLGTHKNWWTGKDWADLWRVTFSTDGNYNPSFSKVANANLTCKSDSTGGTRYCDFAAGAGAYVDGSGRVYVYGVEHYDDAYPGTGYGVKLREFVSQ